MPTKGDKFKTSDLQGISNDSCPRLASGTGRQSPLIFTSAGKKESSSLRLCHDSTSHERVWRTVIVETCECVMQDALLIDRR
jgi:hypothetical protein